MRPRTHNRRIEQKPGKKKRGGNLLTHNLVRLHPDCGLWEKGIDKEGTKEVAAQVQNKYISDTKGIRGKVFVNRAPLLILQYRISPR